ncbi:hypothetical protein HOY82DRAFT_564164, partial [Tuber indicum]
MIPLRRVIPRFHTLAASTSTLEALTASHKPYRTSHTVLPYKYHTQANPQVKTDEYQYPTPPQPGRPRLRKEERGHEPTRCCTKAQGNASCVGNVRRVFYRYSWQEREDVYSACGIVSRRRFGFDLPVKCPPPSPPYAEETSIAQCRYEYSHPPSITV